MAFPKKKYAICPSIFSALDLSLVTNRSLRYGQIEAVRALHLGFLAIYNTLRELILD